MLQWSDTDKMLLLLQFKEGHTGVLLQRCRFLMFVRLQRSTAADKRAGWLLYKVMAQHALRGLLREAYRVVRVDAICSERSAK